MRHEQHWHQPQPGAHLILREICRPLPSPVYSVYTPPPHTHAHWLQTTVGQDTDTATTPTSHSHSLIAMSDVGHVAYSIYTVSTQYLYCIYTVSTLYLLTRWLIPLLASHFSFSLQFLFQVVRCSGGGAGQGAQVPPLAVTRGHWWARSHCGGWAGHWAAGRPMLAPRLTVSSPGGGLALTNCASSCHLCATRAPHCACAVLTRASRNSAGWLRRWAEVGGWEGTRCGYFLVIALRG